MLTRDTRPQAMAAASAPLTDRVNSEPPIINGMAASEAGYIGAVSFAASLFIGCVVAYISGFWVAAPLICIIVPFTVLWYSSLYLQEVKRNRPEGYYLHWMHFFLVSHNLSKPKFLVHDGRMQLGCSYRLNSIRAEAKSSETK